MTVYGYRDGVLKGAEDLDMASAAEQNRRRKTITITQPTKLVSNTGLQVTLPVRDWHIPDGRHKNDSSMQVCYPNHFEARGNDVILPAQLDLPASGSTTIATFNAPTNPNVGHPALTQTEWEAWETYNLSVNGQDGVFQDGHPHIGNWTTTSGNSTQKNTDAQKAELGHRTGNQGPYASLAETFKCGKIGWTERQGQSQVGVYKHQVSISTTQVTLQLMPNGTIQSSNTNVFDPTSLNALYTAQ